MHCLFETARALGLLFGAHWKKRAFCLLTLPKQMPFLTISNKTIFFKTRSNRLGAIVVPNKRLEQALEEVLIYIQITANTRINSQMISNVN